MPSLTSRLLAAATLSLALLRPGLAIGQAELPASVVQSPTLSGPQAQEATQYVANALRLFQSQDWSEARRGRDLLIRPLENPNASVAFRLEYGRGIIGPVAALAAADKPDLTRLNAIRVLGSIGTAQAISEVLPYLDDKNPSIRFMATSAAATTFRALAVGNPALPAGDAVRVAERLARLIEREQDVMVLDGAVIALVEAARVEQNGYAELRDAAFTRLATTMGARLRAASLDTQDEALIAAFLRAGVAARDGLSIARTPLSAPVARELAGYGGDLIAYVVRRAQAGQLPPADAGSLRAAHEQLVAVGEATVFFSIITLQTGSTREPTSLATTLSAGTPDSETQFVQQATNLLRTVLPAAPLNLDASRFLK